jgi:hypothetical protein
MVVILTSRSIGLMIPERGERGERAKRMAEMSNMMPVKPHLMGILQGP